MRQLKILVDMDDTIEHLLFAWVDCLNKRHGLSVKYSDINEWNVCTAFPTLKAEQVYAPLLEDDFWKTVKPIQGAGDVLQWAIEQGHEVYIVTASAYETIKSKMEHVLFKYFPFISWKNVLIAHRKQMIRGDILIDDAPHNLEGGDYVKLLMDANHNMSYDASGNGMIRVHNWNDIQQCIIAIAYEDELKESLARHKEDIVDYLKNEWGFVNLLPFQKILLQSMLGGTN